MTEFRTKGKGKERKVYPVKKQPYGISRELAYKDVVRLREEGKRARLIETNKKHDLYAPYESDLPINEPVLANKSQNVEIPPLNVVTTEEGRKVINSNEEFESSLEFRDAIQGLPQKEQIRLMEEYWSRHLFVSDGFVEQLETLKQEVANEKNVPLDSQPVKKGENKSALLETANVPTRKNMQEHVTLMDSGRGGRYVALITGPDKQYHYQRTFITQLATHDHPNHAARYEGDLPYGAIVDTKDYSYMVVPKSKRFPKGLRIIATEGMENRVRMNRLFAAREKAGYDKVMNQEGE